MQKRLPSIKTPLPGPEAQKVLALDRQFISPSYTRDYPLVVGRGEGMFLTRRSMLVASKMPMTMGKLRSPSVSRSMMTC